MSMSYTVEEWLLLSLDGNHRQPEIALEYFKDEIAICLQMYKTFNYINENHNDNLQALIVYMFISTKFTEANLSIFVYRLFPIICPDKRSENSSKQPVDKYRKISFCNLCV